MKVTVLTPAKNSAATIADTIRTVREQSYSDIEHIVLDGGSTDRTLEVLEGARDSSMTVIEGADRGMYDAINRGLERASGDVVAVLNSDDLYADRDVIRDVVDLFQRSGSDSVYGDIVYVRQTDIDSVVRYWHAGPAGKRSLLFGWTPPHTAFFIKKCVYDRCGYYDIGYRIAADYEMTLRLLYTHGISAAYLDRVCTRMRLGGMSNRDLSSVIRKSSEDLRICKEHRLPHPYWTIAMKNLRKLPQFLQRAPVESGR